MRMIGNTMKHRGNIFSRFRDNEDGLVTAWAISWLILFFAIAGLAVDINNAFKIKQYLQSTADISAHVGATQLKRYSNDTVEAEVKSAANAYAAINMNPDRFGDVLVDTDILVGYWDGSNFTEMTDSDTALPNAVSATTRQTGGTSAAVGTFFLRFAGFDSFSVTANAIAEKFIGQCEYNGILANGAVKFSTQQTFTGTYCVHGQLGLDMSNDNNWGLDTVASTFGECGPSADTCTDEKNQNIETILIEGLSRINPKPELVGAYWDSFWYPDSNTVYPSTFETISFVEINQSDFDPTQLESDTVYKVTCSANNLSMGIPPNRGNPNNVEEIPSYGSAITVLGPDKLMVKDVVIVGDGCDFVFNNEIAYADSWIITNSTSNQSISASNDANFGDGTTCTDPAGTVLITAGDMHFASKWGAYGVEMIASGDVHLSSEANATGIHVGTNIYAGGDVQITTKHSFTSCPTDMAPVFDKTWTVRLVQ